MEVYMNSSDEAFVEATAAQSVEAPVEVEAATQLPENRKTASASARKIAANRKNSEKSTGPKTRKGKAHSRRNALKLGLFAMDVRIESLTRGKTPRNIKHCGTSYAGTTSRRTLTKS
jgi:hypothetical protein